MSNMKTPDIVADARWLPHHLDMAKRSVTFGRFERATLSNASFADYRIKEAAQSWADVSFDELFAADGLDRTKKPVFLFHTSYCCSTLLSRALDKPGRALALREPEIMMGLSNAYRMAQSQSDRETADRLRDVLLALIARPHIGDERVVVKPTNAANNIIPIITGQKIPVILLYGDLRGFLASVIKKGDPCKTIIRQIYRVFAMDNMGVSAIPQRDALALTDLQIAALVWRHQVELFNAILHDPARASARSLDFRTLLNKPAETLLASSNHLGLGLNEDICKVVASSELFRKDAKDTNLTYDAARRTDEERALMDQHAEALDLIENWAFKLSLWKTTTRRLPNPVVA